MSEQVRNDGGPAFGYPNFGCTSTPDGMIQPQHCGGPGNISVRDYFAAKAMQAAMTSDVGRRSAIELNEETGNWIGVAGHAYRIADAMLKAREQSTEVGK